jgi:predicted metalloprotease with PDZ domain
VPVKTLIDSPLLAGAHLQRIPLGGDHPVTLDLLGETAEALAITPAEKTHFANLVAEAVNIFGGSRYDHYEMELTLGDQTDHYTLEHLQASENRLPTRGLTDARIMLTSASLIPHEYTHSWNGKWRPPVKLDNPLYMDPIDGSLLWLYEGLTEYVGNVLTGRSSFWTEDQVRQSLAIDAAQMATHTGRTWRSLQDTTTGAQLLYTAPMAWSAARRATDFYPESALIWLDADTLIREKTQGKKSMDDFCRTFFAPQGGKRPRPYTFEDIVAGMNVVMPYDWRTFLRERLDSTSPQPPLAGIERSGWKLTYTEEMPELMRAMQETRKTDLLWPLWEKADFSDQRYSIGLLVSADGTVMDGSPGMAGLNAGIVPGMRIVEVNGAKFSVEALEQAVKATKQGGGLEFQMENGTFRSSAKVDYHDGLRYPQLERVESKPDMLHEILAAQAKR